MLDPNPEIFCENIRTLGLITGNAGRAEEYCEFYRDVYNRIVSETSAVGPEERPNVFFKAIGRTSPEQITTYGKEMPWAESFFDAAGEQIKIKIIPSAIQVIFGIVADRIAVHFVICQNKKELEIRIRDFFGKDKQYLKEKYSIDNLSRESKKPILIKIN